MHVRQFFADIRKSWDTKEALPLIGVACAWLAVLALSLSFLPLWVSLLNVIVVVFGVFVALRDALRLMNLERENSFHTSRLKRVIENMREGVIVYSPQFEILEINRAALEMLGLPDGIVGTTVTPQRIDDAVLGILTKIIYPSLASRVQQLSKEGWPQIVQIGIPAPSSREFLTVTDRVTDKADKAVGFVKIIQDKTEEREMSASKTEFVSTTAHELRTPLTGIKWVFESLGNSVKDTETLSFVNQGLELADRGLKLVNSMLEVAQIEEGKAAYHMKPFDITLTMQNILGEARPIAEQYGISVSFSKPDPLSVTGDEERIRAALETIVENAIKYNSAEGTVTVKLAKEDARVHITVQDTGIGIPEAEQRNLFNKFARGEEAKRIDPNGAGLGLYFAKSIIVAHRGEIRVDSTVGRGSTFHITLPLTPNN